MKRVPTAEGTHVWFKNFGKIKIFGDLIGFAYFADIWCIEEVTIIDIIMILNANHTNM